MGEIRVGTGSFSWVEEVKGFHDDGEELEEGRNRAVGVQGEGVPHLAGCDVRGVEEQCSCEVLHPQQEGGCLPSLVSNLCWEEILRVHHTVWKEEDQAYGCLQIQMGGPLADIPDHFLSLPP